MSTLGRRSFLAWAGLAAAGVRMTARAAEKGTINDFEETLYSMRAEFYRHPKVDILKEGFRPVGGKIADFATAELNGVHHFYYIERRLQEGTPFYPGHETYFGHASTSNFFDWEVHEPVLMVRPGTWEGGHVWAPCIIKRGSEFVMAYTGVSSKISQDIGFASSTDLFEWKRWDSNPLRLLKDSSWAEWSADHISSCRDPDIAEHDGTYYMIYTANTKKGASVIALASSRDLKKWKDHGPIISGPNSGYEPKLEGGHKQGSLESARLIRKNGKWYLLVKAALKDRPFRQGIIPSETLEGFDWKNEWDFWKEGICIETVKERGDKTLLAGMSAGFLKFAEVDWSADKPVAATIKTKEALEAWQG